MKPEIRYTRTADGADLAYYTMGEGPPLVFTSTVNWSHLHLQPVREYHRSKSGKGLGRGLQIVRYDARGTGLSDHNALDFSLDARLLDLEAVVERLELRQFALFGWMIGALTAIAYAATHPDRVSRLVLMNPLISGADWRESMRRFDSIRDIAEEDWEMYTLTLTNSMTGFRDSALAQRIASFYRESMTPEGQRRAFDATQSIDVTSLLPDIQAPTLIMNVPVREERMYAALAQKAASNIPDARLVKFTGRPLEWTDEQTHAVETFLGVDAPTVIPGRQPSKAAGTSVILFTDIADSTALTERMGDAAFRAAARALDDRMRAAIREAGGTPVEGKVLGDGVMAVFASAAQAIDAARRCVALSGESELRLHIGLHAGDVIRERDNVYGGAVNIASRICGLSGPGEILVSGTIRDLARTSAGVAFEDRGEHALKGIEDAVRVFAVK
jgi:class 3 adenylate cyclase/pimeloyl-ACP methyl ester carboxylesterase